MFWKNSHIEDDFKDSQFLQKKHIKALGKAFNHSEQPRGVAPAKKRDIVQTLSPFLQQYRRVFWESLPVNEESLDLATERDESENVDQNAI